MTMTTTMEFHLLRRRLWGKTCRSIDPLPSEKVSIIGRPLYSNGQQLNPALLKIYHSSALVRWVAADLSAGRLSVSVTIHLDFIPLAVVDKAGTIHPWFPLFRAQDLRRHDPHMVSLFISGADILPLMRRYFILLLPVFTRPREFSYMCVPFRRFVQSIKRWILRSLVPMKPCAHISLLLLLLLLYNKKSLCVTNTQLYNWFSLKKQISRNFTSLLYWMRRKRSSKRRPRRCRWPANGRRTISNPTTPSSFQRDSQTSSNLPDQHSIQQRWYIYILRIPFFIIQKRKTVKKYYIL